MADNVLLHDPPAPPGVYTLSLHDALPILLLFATWFDRSDPARPLYDPATEGILHSKQLFAVAPSSVETANSRSEEHTSELQSHSDVVCCLLLETKKHATAAGGALHKVGRR